MVRRSLVAREIPVQLRAFTPIKRERFFRAFPFLLYLACFYGGLVRVSDLVLALDLGTGSVKAGLVTQAGEIAAQASVRYPVTSLVVGWSETDPADWWAGVVQAVREVMRDVVPERVQGISFSGQMHGVVLADDAGKPLRNAVLWSDTRSSAELAAYDAALLGRLRNPAVTGFAGPSLLWLKKHEPDVYAAARYALQPKDWLRFHLTGEAFTEPSDASGTLLYDLERNEWDAGVLESLQLNPALLPRLQASASLAGTLKPERAAELGLLAHLPVIAGAADTAASLLGSALQAGEAQLTVGTGAQIVVASKELPGARTGLHVFRDAQDGFYTLAAVQNAGNVLEWVRSVLRLSWPDMYTAAKEVDGQDVPLFLPYLTGDRTPHLDPHARAGWVSLGAAHDHRHLAYAAFEGVALSIAQAAELLDLPAAQPLKLAGGGTLDPWWRQLLADALGQELQVVEVPAASLLGAAKLAWEGAGQPMTCPPPAVMESIQPRPERLRGRHQAFSAAYSNAKAQHRNQEETEISLGNSQANQ